MGREFLGTVRVYYAGSIKYRLGGIRFSRQFRHYGELLYAEVVRLTALNAAGFRREPLNDALFQRLQEED